MFRSQPYINIYIRRLYFPRLILIGDAPFASKLLVYLSRHCCHSGVAELQNRCSLHRFYVTDLCDVWPYRRYHQIIIDRYYVCIVWSTSRGLMLGFLN